MPPNDARNAPFYTERLFVPARWWFITFAGVAVAGAEVFAGFNWKVALIVYAAIGLPMVALLLATGHARVTVDAEGLHAGKHTLPREAIDAVAPLDAAETKRWLGPGGDPAAHVVAKGFIKQSVLVRPIDPDEHPYWLISTRHPQQLVDALARTPVS
jgi:hypothetical protein